MSPYLDVFVEETREHLNNLNQYMLKLESNPDNHSFIDEIFRSCHTIKGMAGTMGFDRISIITHEMENLLQDVRDGKIDISSKLIDILFEFIDIIEALTNAVSQTGSESNKDIDVIVNKLKNILNDEDSVQIIQDEPIGEATNIFNEFELNLIETAYNRNLMVYEIEVLLNEDCLLKSARAFLVFKNLEELGEIIKTVPTVEDIEDENFEDSFTLYLITRTEGEKIKNIVDSISEVKKTNIKIIDYLEKEDGQRKNGNILIEESDIKDKEILSQEITKQMTRIKTTKTVRVDIEKLDNLMNLVSELIIIKTRVEGISDDKGNIGAQELHETIEYLERITGSLHDAVMKVRMVPIEQVFNRFPRMVRDLSKELDKEVLLHIEGEETELDRTVIDEIGDPLIHLIRNAIDHGIESPALRGTLGKPPQGEIQLKAYHDGNHVVIELKDDGKGIDLDKTLEKAVELGMFSERQLENINDTDILNLLFNPGFSTTREVTDLSGRGVGLDVVKTKIESLGGTIDISTKVEEGTKFTIRLPLTLAIIQALLIDVSGEKYAIPLNLIKETITFNPRAINSVRNREVILHRGSVLPIIRLDEVLDCDKCSDYTDENDITIVVVNEGDRQAGLVVDSLIGQQEIVIKSLGRLLNNIKIIAGATILGNGQVALILDTNSLV